MKIRRSKSGRATIRLLLMLAIGSGIHHSCAPVEQQAHFDRPWPWWPTSMEVSSLTRIGRPEQNGIRPVEVRVRFQDSAGDTCKAAGELKLKITRAGEPGDPEERSFDLADRTIQRRLHETVTGCYSIPVFLELPGMVPGRLLRIGVEYEGIDGSRFTAQRDLVLERSLRPAE